MKMLAAASLACSILTGCVSGLMETSREPHLTPVGSGMQTDHAIIADVEFPSVDRSLSYSTWDDRQSSLFRDPRAATLGDVVTVEISINDKASLDNNSDRARSSSSGLGLNLATDFPFGGLEASGDGDARSNSSSQGRGSIARAETIELSVAAVVMEVLPNNNLLISGSQEVRVNNEVRVLSIAGIVRPRDIGPDNTVPYDKIAEARVSYGGRGRVSEVQQPGWGQQLFDRLTPW